MTHPRRVLAGALAAAALSTSAAAPAADAASVKGKWRGTVNVVKGGTGSFTVVMKITKLEQGKRGGRISIPGACFGPITLKSRKGPKYLFQYREKSGVKGCTGDDKVTVNLAGGKLAWKGVSPAASSARAASRASDRGRRQPAGEQPDEEADADAAQDRPASRSIRIGAAGTPRRP